jgi:gliding motility-associated-like protein
LFPDSSLWISLTLTNQYGCSTADSIIIQSTGLSANDFTIHSQQDTVLLGNSTEITVLPTGDFTYSWQPVNATGNTVVVTPEQNTVYSVTITDSLGCSYRKYITIYAIDVICDEPYIYIPNAFTPNGDGKNDVLYIRGEYIEQLDLKIFDRWGELVFETDKQAKGWDGTYKGEPVEPAVFVYHVKVKCLGGEEFFKKGNITVIR